MNFFFFFVSGYIPRNKKEEGERAGKRKRLNIVHLEVRMKRQVHKLKFPEGCTGAPYRRVESGGKSNPELTFPYFGDPPSSCNIVPHGHSRAVPRSILIGGQTYTSKEVPLSLPDAPRHNVMICPGSTQTPTTSVRSLRSAHNPSSASCLVDADEYHFWLQANQTYLAEQLILIVIYPKQGFCTTITPQLCAKIHVFFRAYPKPTPVNVLIVYENKHKIYLNEKGIKRGATHRVPQSELSAMDAPSSHPSSSSSHPSPPAQEESRQMSVDSSIQYNTLFYNNYSAKDLTLVFPPSIDQKTAFEWLQRNRSNHVDQEYKNVYGRECFTLTFCNVEDLGELLASEELPKGCEILSCIEKRNAGLSNLPIGTTKNSLNEWVSNLALSKVKTVCLIQILT